MFSNSLVLFERFVPLFSNSLVSFGRFAPVLQNSLVALARFAHCSPILKSLWSGLLLVLGFLVSFERIAPMSSNSLVCFERFNCSKGARKVENTRSEPLQTDLKICGQRANKPLERE